jgi:GTPase
LTKRRPKPPEELVFPPGSEENGPEPIVAIVGRPNVGKSTLFNRLVGQRIAIVHDEPGVTRDRHYGRAFFGGRGYTLVDTGGFDPESGDPMQESIARQVELAIEEADVVVCVLDAEGGLTDPDRRAVKLLRKSQKPVIYAANKADKPVVDADAAELYQLGITELYPVSALHGRGFGELENAMIAALPPVEEWEQPAEGEVSRPVRVALIGRPNAGKSSTINQFAGAERVLVDSRPGTTRDAIDTLVTRGDTSYILVDTAGIRRKAKVQKEDSLVEAVSVLHAIRAIERCDIAVMLCDASEGVTEQDAKILGLAVERGRGVIVVLNKMDLCDAERIKAVELRTRELLAFAPWVPIHKMSAKTGRGLTGLVKMIDEVYAAFQQRVPTGQLNRFFEQVLETHPPPTQGGKAPRLYYITQATSRPPLFVVMSNNPEAIHFSYQRYVVNQIRKAFGFDGVPVRIRYKARRKHMWDRSGGGEKLPSVDENEKSAHSQHRETRANLSMTFTIKPADSPLPGRGCGDRGHRTGALERRRGAGAATQICHCWRWRHRDARGDCGRPRLGALRRRASASAAPRRLRRGRRRRRRRPRVSPGAWVRCVAVG